MHSPEEIAYLKKLGQDTGVFYFKQFQVEDSHSTMKVGTDAVLLGITAEVARADKILEVGTGSGVIALLLAQRSNALIDAVEVDPDSAAQARENAMRSPWKKRITVHRNTFQDFAKKTPRHYDVIVSNPPFFTRSFKSAIDRKNLSRHDLMLTFSDLASSSRHLLNDRGSLWVILPVKESEYFIKEASHHGFYRGFTLEVIPKEGKEANRMVMQFSTHSLPDPMRTSLTLRRSDNSFSLEYMEYARDYYIDF